MEFIGLYTEWPDRKWSDPRLLGYLELALTRILGASNSSEDINKLGTITGIAFNRPTEGRTYKHQTVIEVTATSLADATTLLASKLEYKDNPALLPDGGFTFNPIAPHLEVFPVESPVVPAGEDIEVKI